MIFGKKKSGDGLNLLVVEDDPDLRAMLCSRLEKLGHNPIDYESGVELLREIGNLQIIDVAFIDVQMPEMDGYELLQRLRAMSRFENLPIIMVTSKRKDDEILEGYGKGADYYITKPYTSDQLEYGLKAVLEGT